MAIGEWWALIQTFESKADFQTVNEGRILWACISSVPYLASKSHYGICTHRLHSCILGIANGSKILIKKNYIFLILKCHSRRSKIQPNYNMFTCLLVIVKKMTILLALSKWNLLSSAFTLLQLWPVVLQKHVHLQQWIIIYQSLIPK